MTVTVTNSRTGDLHRYHVIPDETAKAYRGEPSLRITVGTEEPGITPPYIVIEHNDPDSAARLQATVEDLPHEGVEAERAGVHEFDIEDKSDWETHFRKYVSSYDAPGQFRYKAVLRFKEEELATTAADDVLEQLLDHLYDNELLMQRDRMAIIERQEKFAGHYDSWMGR